MSEYILGVDIGGEIVDIGVVTFAGNVKALTTIPTNAGEGPDACIKRIVETVSTLLGANGINREDIRGVGIGAPGPLHLENGKMINPPHLPQTWWNYPIRDKVSTALDMDAALDNDANAAALAESWIGAATQARDFLVLTLGMGVGGGVMVDRKILRGADGCAGELGHVCVYPEGRECACGKQGCLEAYASAVGILGLYRDNGGSSVSSVKDVFDLARAGDTTAQAVIAEASKALGTAIGTLLNVFNPECVVVAGRLSQSFDLMEHEVMRSCADHAFETPLARVPTVTVSPLKEKSGVVGAAGVFGYDAGIIENISTEHAQFSEPLHIIAAHVGASGMRFAVVELKDNLNTYTIEKTVWHPGKASDREEVLHLATSGIQECLSASGMSAANVRGVSIVTPGTIDIARKLIIFSPNINWRNVKIEQELHTRVPDLKADIFVERDAVAMALAEKMFGESRALHNFAVLYLGTGVGVGLILNGRPYRGSHGQAGEIGHTTIDCASNRRCSCGGTGCLECYASGKALCEHVVNHMKQGQSTSLSHVEESGAEILYFDVVQAADRGDDLAIRAFGEMGERLAIGVRNLFSELDLERLVVSGPLARGGRHFLDILRKNTASTAFKLRETDIVLSKIQENELVGVIAAFVDQTRTKG
ncbi:MAG TPA: ROK family protein [Candidatus Bathyarchaeia archaeon]|nr:ROK family protein [Candidatus Bathyarchaeia archaeon]